MGSVFGSKPSEAHVMWRSDQNNDGAQRKPRTFVATDEEGMGRLRGRTDETTLEIDEQVLKKTVLKLKTVDGTVKKPDVRILSKHPETTSS